MRMQGPMTLVAIGLVLLMVLVLRVTLAQTPPAPVACETQVQEQYRQLVTDQMFSAQAATWGDQLSTITGEFRVLKTQLELKQGQLAQAERNLAVLVERQRQLQQTIAQQRAEVEQLKSAASPAPEKPPAN